MRCMPQRHGRRLLGAPITCLIIIFMGMGTGMMRVCSVLKSFLVIEGSSGHRDLKVEGSKSGSRDADGMQIGVVGGHDKLQSIVGGHDKLQSIG